MPERTEHALLYIKYVDDALAEQGVAAVEGAISGISLRILARALPDGRTSVAVSLYRRVHRMRASGKTFHYWTSEKLTSMARTKKNLVVLREFLAANVEVRTADGEFEKAAVFQQHLAIFELTVAHSRDRI